MNTKLKGILMLLFTAFIWGSSFVAQKSSMDFIGPYTFNAVRSVIGSAILIPVFLFIDRSKEKKGESHSYDKKTLFTGGILCGIVLFFGVTLQQCGIVYTDSGKAGFITAIYIVLVPVIGIIFKNKVRPLIWGCVLFGAVGLYFLCIPEGRGFGGVNYGDFLVMLSSIAFALHILIADHFSPRTDGVRLSCIQFAVIAVISAVPAILTEDISLSAIIACTGPILYAGVLSSGIGYTLQIVAQKYVEPTLASLILSLESVFSVLAGMVVLHEALTFRELCGCMIMFATIIVAQLPEKRQRSEGCYEKEKA